MHHLRDALLSPSPKGPIVLGGLDSISHDAQGVRESAARQEFDVLRGAAFYNRTWIISDRYCNEGDGVDTLEGYLHSIWHTYYQLARHTAHKTSEMDRLVLDIVRIQGLGPLCRPVRGNYGIDIARTVEGTLWNDLPFLATDMTDFWINNCASLSGVQRLNFASFLAKLASVRVNKDRVSQVAILLFCSAFETTQALSNLNDPDNADTHRTYSMLELKHLLPSVCVWIKEANHVLIQLSDVWWNNCPSMVGRGSSQFVKSEFGKRSPTGFSPWRLMYWLKRLHEIQDEAKAANTKDIEEMVIDAISRLSKNIKTRSSGTLRVYQNGGDFLHENDHLACLRSGY